MLKIALGDLRHKVGGRHSVFMPIGIGYIAAYTLSRLEKDKVEIRLYDDPEKILKDIEDWKPNIIGLSNYSWNSELSRLIFEYAKEKFPKVVCVGGGPEFPIDNNECQQYLLSRPEIDFYVYLEGEQAFADLIVEIERGTDIEKLKRKPQNGIMSINPKNNKLVAGEPMPKLVDLDQIPSPYLIGLMDEWFDGRYSPAIETTRGCPFTCAYCFTGQQFYNRVANFSIKRVKDELTYIAKKMRDYPNILLLICDSDFGMYERDEEIALHLRSLQDKYGWPINFDVSTGKTNYDRILKIAGILKNKMHITCSVQSLNQKTLKAIKRYNIPLEEYEKISLEMKRKGMNSMAELIVPLPEETKESFFDGLVKVIDKIRVDRVAPYTTMLLKGTLLASEEYRKKYRMMTRFRMIPKQFGEYLGKKCFEVEEVCIATNTMSFEDYLEVRGFSLVVTIFSNEQFDVIHRHLEELGIGVYDYFYLLWQGIKSGQTVLSDLYQEYLRETKDELLDCPEDIYNYFSQPKNYQKLMTGELGDNLIRKYTIKLLIEKYVQAIELCYLILEKIANQVITDEIYQSLEAAKSWTVSLRNVSEVFNQESSFEKDKIINLDYDVNSWYLAGVDSKWLVKYKKSSVYRIYYEIKKIKRILFESERLHGGDLNFQVGRILNSWSIKEFWRKCKSINL